MVEAIEGTLSKTEVKAVVRLLKDCQAAFSKDKDDLGYCDLASHAIKLVPNAKVKHRFRKMPLAKYQEAKAEVQRLLDVGAIEPSCSSFASPIVLVRKPNGSIRFCIDYRQLNDLTIKDNYPLPRITETIDSLRGSCYFSCLDLLSGYWQMPVLEEDKHKTAFVVPWGLYQFKRLPMGLCNAPASFERLMERVLVGLNWEICLVYLDDIIVFARSFPEHLERLRQVLMRLIKNNLKLCPAKCFIFRLFVKFLGHIVSGRGVACDPEKTEAIRDWPVPVDVSQVRSFLGLCSYYRRFAPSFATIAAPMYQLTEAKSEFLWTSDCQAAFEHLKRLLCSAPILAYPLDQGQYTLDTDASLVGLGAVLSQEQDGEERVIAYYSRSLSKPERNYCVTRLELLAVVNAVKHFHTYLYGRRFTVRTDHASLKWLLNFKEPEGQIARFLEVLSMYFPFDVVHRPGAKHGNADGLSRRPCGDCSYCERQELKAAHRAETAVGNICSIQTVSMEDYSLVTPWSSAQLKSWQCEDPTLSKVRQWIRLGERPPWEEMKLEGRSLRSYWAMYSSLVLIEDVLHVQMIVNGKRDSQVRLVVPEAVRRQIFQYLHTHRTGGHLGEKKVVAKALQRFWWPGARRDLIRWVQYCDRCQRRKGRPGRGRAPLEQEGVGSPMERLAFDILSFPQATANGNTCVLVVCCYFTKWAEAFALKDHQAVTVAETLVEQIFLRYGVPHFLHSDRAPEFMSSLMREICSLLEINRTRTCPYRPQSDGLVERMNRTLIDMLSKFVGTHLDDWDDHLNYVLCAYRASRNESTGCTPNLLMLGREITLPVDLMFLNASDIPYRCHNEYAEWVRTAMLENFELAREMMRGAAVRQKRLYDQRTASRNFKIGQWVLRFYPPLRNKDKLNSPFVGPYLIVGKPGEVTYTLQETQSSDPFTVHVDHLKEYKTEEPLVSWLSNPDEPPAGEAASVSISPSPVLGDDQLNRTGDYGTMTRRGSRIRRPPDRYDGAAY